MEYTRLFVLALFCLALVGTDASQSGENYWKSVWPNTPMPKALSDLLLPYNEINVPIRAEEEKQYWTVFFEHDLYPGKKMNLGIHKHSDIEHFHSSVRVPFKKPSQSVGAHTSGEASQPFGTLLWVEKESQPFGAGIWVTREKASQPFGARTWGQYEKAGQPFGAGIWVTREKASQPFGARTWGQYEKDGQSFRVRTRGQEKDSLDNFCMNPSAIGEEKYCASSLESMMNFAMSKLGTNIKVISSSFAENQDQYVVEEVRKIGDKAVMCHRLNFEKVVFYCHQVNASMAYMVPLVASDGTKAKALAICHHDTRGMNPDVLYNVLKVKPGTVPICHFVGNKAVAWVPNDDVNESHDHPCVI